MNAPTPTPTPTPKANPPTLSIVAPLYNEADAFDQLRQRLTAVMDAQPELTEVVLVDDGSRDATPHLMRAWALADPRIQAVFLARNVGHQRALSAGLRFAKATEAVFVIDGDLQDPPELLPDFLARLREGHDVVYAIRQNRKEGWLKKLAYRAYYRLLKRMANLELPLDAGDFALMSRRVVDCLNHMPEANRYLRGMRAWVGFPQVGLAYDRQARVAGESKYTWRKLMRLATDGLFAFSDAPIKLITNVGAGVFALALLYLVYMLGYYLATGGDLPEGYPTLVFALILFSGVQMLALGVIGEYVLRIYGEVRQRPLFVVAGHVAQGQPQPVPPLAPPTPVVSAPPHPAPHQPTPPQP